MFLKKEEAIVFYDGGCGLCQRSMIFLLKRDKKKSLLFAPLNGKTYQKIYGSCPDSLTTLKLYYKQKTFEKSSAILELSFLLGGIYKFFYILKLIPVPLRDIFYDQLAKRRKSFQCNLDDQNKLKKNRLLD